MRRRREQWPRRQSVAIAGACRCDSIPNQPSDGPLIYRRPVDDPSRLDSGICDYSGESGLADALVENKDEVEGIITGIDGFRAYYLIKTADGCASISVFDDESGASESTRAAGEWVRENLPEHAGTPPQVTSGEVVIDF